MRSALKALIKISQIIEEHSSGWTFVRNEDSGESGWVPAWVVSRERPAVQRVYFIILIESDSITVLDFRQINSGC